MRKRSKSSSPKRTQSPVKHESRVDKIITVVKESSTRRKITGALSVMGIVVGIILLIVGQTMDPKSGSTTDTESTKSTVREFDYGPTAGTTGINLAVGVAMTPVKPVFPDGIPYIEYSVSPPLPAGLVLNPHTGVISGTPTETSAPATYTITGTHPGGYDPALIYLMRAEEGHESYMYTNQVYLPNPPRTWVMSDIATNPLPGRALSLRKNSVGASTETFPVSRQPIFYMTTLEIGEVFSYEFSAKGNVGIMLAWDNNRQRHVELNHNTGQPGRIAIQTSSAFPAETFTSHSGWPSGSTTTWKCSTASHNLGWNTSVWSHFGFTYTRTGETTSAWRIYVNGVLRATSHGAFTAIPIFPHILTRVLSGGYVDEIAMYMNKDMSSSWPRVYGNVSAEPASGNTDILLSVV